MAFGGREKQPRYLSYSSRMSFTLISEAFCKEMEGLLSSCHMQIFLGSINYHFAMQAVVCH